MSRRSEYWVRWDQHRAALGTAFPAAFPPDGQPRPALTIGVHRLLEESGVVPRHEVRLFLREWVRRPQYLRAVAAGGHRVVLNGSPAEPITPEQVELAQTLLARRARKGAAA
ncbi:ProQ/FinO family protein [Pararoseomonas sp. SCSIO 73927]|uniref:ProQ/FinO family protein n=1 Tax=Pararoseomonas sp. SCSIO 73927 TaxID=3114537 RepID=UPI0030D4B881